MTGRDVVEVVASPLTILDVRRRADLAGFGYETMAGWRPIATFDAYGMAPPDGEIPAGVNWGPKWSPYQCELIRLSDGSLSLRDLPDPKFPSYGHPIVLGAFPVAELLTECPGCGYALETPVPTDDGNPCPCQYADNEGYRGEL